MKFTFSLCSLGLNPDQGIFGDRADINRLGLFQSFVSATKKERNFTEKNQQHVDFLC